VELEYGTSKTHLSGTCNSLHRQFSKLYNRSLEQAVGRSDGYYSDNFIWPGCTSVIHPSCHDICARLDEWITTKSPTTTLSVCLNHFLRPWRCINIRGSNNAKMIGTLVEQVAIVLVDWLQYLLDYLWAWLKVVGLLKNVPESRPPNLSDH